MVDNYRDVFAHLWPLIQEKSAAAAADATVSASSVSAHDIFAAHTYTGGSPLDVFGFSAASTLALITPSSNPDAASAILKSDSSGYLTLQKITINKGSGQYGSTHPFFSALYNVDTYNFFDAWMDGYRSTVLQPKITNGGNGYLVLAPEGSKTVICRNGDATNAANGTFTVYDSGSSTVGAHIPTTWAITSVGRVGVVRGEYAFYLDVVGTSYAEFSTYNYGSSAAFPMVFQGNGGDVSIGTTTDAARLTVNGAVSIADGQDESSLGGTSGFAKIYFTGSGASAVMKVQLSNGTIKTVTWS
jgi:hypothetical protein